MDAVLPSPSATAFDAASSVISAAVFLLVALGALVHAPRDPRVRVFALVALAALAPYGFSALVWARGAAAMTLPVVIGVAISLAVGSLALFHFTQIFPWRRPWIARHRGWLSAAYAVLPAVCATLAWALLASHNANLGALSEGAAEVLALVLIAVVLPTIVVLGIVVPFAGLLSLYGSWRAARRAGLTGPRVTTFWILISQLAGGALTILIVPLLHLVAPRGPWAVIATALLFASGLLMPIAFAAGVWRFSVLSLDPGLPPPASSR